MATKTEKLEEKKDEKTNEVISKEEVQDTVKKAKDVEKEVSQKTGERVNIIGDIEKPDRSDPNDVTRFFKEIDEKLNKLLGYHAPKETPKTEPLPVEPPKKVHWFDKELF